MIQTLAVYAIVGFAAGWTAWRLLLRGWMKRRAAAQSASGCGPGCGCGD